MLLTLLLAAAWPAAAQAGVGDLVSQAQVLGVRDVGPGADGILEAGDTVEVVQRYLNPTASPVDGISATLEAAAASQDAEVLDGGRATFPDVDPGQRTANTATPFRVRLGSSVRCGSTLKFAATLRDTSDFGVGVFAVDLRTGTPDVAQVRDTTPATPVTIPSSGATVELPLAVSGFGSSATAADVALRLLDVDHPNASELDISLVPPGSTREIRVVEGRSGAAGTGFTGSVLRSRSGTPLGTGGTYAAGPFLAEALDLLNGSSLDGTWKLRVRDTVGNDGARAGTVRSWGLELAPAVCHPVVRARITGVEAGGTVRAGTPGTPLSLSALDSVLPQGRRLEKVEWDVNADGDYADAGTDVVLDRPASSTSDWTLLPFSKGAAGLYPVRVRITPDVGPSAEDDVLFPFSNPPAISLFAVDRPGPDPTFTDLRFTATADDPDGDTIADYVWDLDDDGTYEETTATKNFIWTSFDRPGDHEVRVRAVDGYGVMSLPSTLVVTATNTAPTASLTIDDWVVRGEVATLSAATSIDRDGRVVDVSFDVDGLPGFEVPFGPERTRDITLTADRTVGIRVRDDEGAIDDETKLVRVHDRPVAAVQATPAAPRPGRTAVLSAAGSYDDNGPIARVEWDKDGNGTFETDTGTGTTTAVSWPTEGARSVGVRVTDLHGATSVAQTTVTVQNLKPLATFAVVPAAPVAGATVTYDASASADPEDGAVASFDWDLDGNGTYERTNAGPVVQRAYPSAMTARVGLRVRDSDGGQGTTSRTIAIAAASSVAPPVVVTPPAGPGTGGDAALPVVDATGAPVVPGPAGAVPDAAAPGTAQAAARPTVRLVVAPGQRLAALLGSGLRTTCTATGATVCTVRVTLDVVQARRLRLARRAKAPVTLGARSGRLGAARVEAKRALVARLRRASSVRVVVSATVADTGGRATVTRTLTLKR